jgi:acyl-CoA reductase-like NAD-dependent aldehyde dehydrogenase
VTTLTPSHFGLFGDSEAFQMPVPGLFADVDDGAASVALPDEFLDLPGETRARILQQWGRAISAHENAALVEMFHEFAAPLSGISIVEQIDRFRNHCGHLKIACPAKLAVLLQRY